MPYGLFLSLSLSFSLFSTLLQVDKASLLAKAVQHMKELKQRAAEIEKIEQFPSEIDEISVYPDNGRPFFTVSLFCEDREGLIPELGETVKSLRLRILRAEIATLGGRVRNVLVVEREVTRRDREVVDFTRSRVKN